jgi:hypothetical protein
MKIEACALTFQSMLWVDFLRFLNKTNGGFSSDFVARMISTYLLRMNGYKEYDGSQEVQWTPS